MLRCSFEGRAMTRVLFLVSPLSQSFPQSSSYSECVRSEDRKGRYEIPTDVSGRCPPHEGISRSARKRSNSSKKEAGVGWNAEKPRTLLSVMSFTHSTMRPRSPSVCHQETS
jgi:hypothetical protein